MQRINQFMFYQLGVVLGELKKLTAELTYYDAYGATIDARYELEEFVGDAIIPLIVSVAAIGKLIKTLKAFAPPEGDDENFIRWTKTKLDQSQLAILHRIVEEFETIFAAELATLDSYYVSRKGIYSTKALIEHADEAIPDSLRARLLPQAIQDFREAGKCLAFDVFTAVGYHVLRAVDAVLRQYFTKFIGRAPDKQERNLGGALHVLKDCTKDPPPNPKTLSMIEQVKDLHRNPVIHPEINLSGEEALGLFDLCKAAIISMAMEL
jgi:hypothetical protein